MDFLFVSLGALGTGITFSLKKYVRPGRTGTINKVYKNGNTYNALKDINKEQ